MALKTNLEGRTAVITGASEGIGKSAAKLLASEGVHLILSDRNNVLLDELKKEIKKNLRFL